MNYTSYGESGTLPARAMRYAVEAHKKTNHTYDGLPYEVHLLAVVDYAVKYKHLLDPAKIYVVMAGAWCHDLIEDTRQTYAGIKNVLCEEVADIVYALTNEKGRNREERANAKYYKELSENHLAIYVKICDRLANVQHSIETQNTMLHAYKKEHTKFELALYHPHFEPMFNELKHLLNTTI